jgi:DNA-binding NarL/FixJ family response regulator
MLINKGEERMKKNTKVMSNADMRRKMILQLLDKGWSTKQIVEALELPRQSVAAYKAHRTMGRY